MYFDFLKTLDNVAPESLADRTEKWIKNYLTIKFKEHGLWIGINLGAGLGDEPNSSLPRAHLPSSDLLCILLLPGWLLSGFRSFWVLLPTRPFPEGHCLCLATSLLSSFPGRSQSSLTSPIPFSSARANPLLVVLMAPHTSVCSTHHGCNFIYL